MATHFAVIFLGRAAHCGGLTPSSITFRCCCLRRPWLGRRVILHRGHVSASATVKMEEEVKFVGLPDGRRIAYREQGLGRDMAKRSLLVLHGLGSSRIAGMPGVSEELLKEMGVRLVSIDRPGYGLSDFNPKQTLESAAKDFARVADILELGKKIWLLGYSCGGAYCWGAARFIPERIAGIAMWAPVGNLLWKDISEVDRKFLIAHNSRKSVGIVKKLPHWMLYAYVQFVTIRGVGSKWVENARTSLSPPDRCNLELKVSAEMMERDSIESAKQKGKGLAQDLLLISTGHWGFELSEVPKFYHGPLHIFNGDQDWLVSLALQEYIKQLQPDLVHLHSLLGEGHLSAFCFNDKVHLDTLGSLFGSAGSVTEVTVGEIPKRQDLTAVKSVGVPNTLSEEVQEDLWSPYIH